MKQTKSIISNERRCFKCHATDWVEMHHIFCGTANRDLSEKYGLKVYLCNEHHQLAHQNGKFTQQLKQIAREAFEKEYPYNFTRIFYGDGIEELRDDR